MADAVPPTAGTSPFNAPCTVRCWSCGQWFGSPEDFGPEAEYTCAKCWANLESVDSSVDFPACPVSRIRWWHRTVSGLALAACTVVAAGVCWLVSWLALCVFLGGCAVGYPLRGDGTADTGDAIIGISTGTANAAGAGLLSLGGLLSGNPAIVGLAALVANQMGKRAGWDERESAAMVQAPLPDAKGGKA